MPIQFIHCQLSANIYSLPMPIQFIHCQLSANFPYSLSIVCITAKSKIPCQFFFFLLFFLCQTYPSGFNFLLFFPFRTAPPVSFFFPSIFAPKALFKKTTEDTRTNDSPIPYVYIPSKGPIFIFCARSARLFF